MHFFKLKKQLATVTCCGVGAHTVSGSSTYVSSSDDEATKGTSSSAQTFGDQGEQRKHSPKCANAGAHGAVVVCS
jgi:hypothetical protein